MTGTLFLAAAVAFGFVTGTLSGLLGVGGGIFMVPFLVLAGGAAQQQAQATSLLVVLPMAAVATWSLRRAGVGDHRAALRMGAVGAIGSVAGTLLALALPAGILKAIFAVLMIIIALRLLRDAAPRRQERT